MKVRSLVKKLEKLDQNAEVIIDYGETAFAVVRKVETEPFWIKGEETQAVTLVPGRIENA